MTTKPTDQRTAKAKAARLVSAAFPPGRPRRSPEYLEGMTAQAIFRLCGKHSGCKYAEGTCQADAFFAGVDEGKGLAIEEPQP